MSTAGALDRTRPPPSEELRPLELPLFHRFRLDNGLKLLVAENRKLPEVSLRLILEAGAAAEQPELGGVAELTGRLLSEGAAGRSAMEMAAWLDRLGAAFRASVGYDVASLSMHFLSDVSDGALDYLRAVVREPAFEEEEVARVRQERLDEIERHLDEPAVLADLRLIRTIYGGHPYGRPAGGVPETVASLGAAGVAGFHRERYVPDGAVLIACGALDARAFRDAVALRFDDWTGAAGPAGLPAPSSEAPAGGLLLVDREHSAQAEIRVGRIGMEYAAPDFFAATLANAILGGLFNSRINMNLREDKGWTYGARSSFRFRRGAGPFVVSTAVESAAAAGAFREILAEIKSLVERPPDDDELRLAKNALTLSLPRQFETPSLVTGKVATQQIYELPEDYWETYVDRVEAVTPEEIVDAAGSRIPFESMTLLAVASAAEVRPMLEEVGDVSVENAESGC
ncbi:MAG: pitrilysin family protein [Gemmatimonadota bacterium]